MTLTTGPCSNWPIYWGDLCSDFVSAASPTVTGYAATTATHILWSLSGRQFGTCPVVLRPCRESCWEGQGGGYLGSYAYPWSSYGGPLASAGWDASYWFPLGCGSCVRGSCSCNTVSQVWLPARVNDVTAVKVDGAALPGTSYRLDDNQFLVRTDGSLWPRCNDLNKDDTAVGTWSVAADYGITVPDSGRFAMGEMVCQILRALSNEDCQLPQNVVRLVRQGVTVDFPPIQALLKEGRTGLYLVDLFLTAVNPNGLDQRARVYSVDRMTPRRTGT
jgi:hypothetical protein